MPLPRLLRRLARPAGLPAGGRGGQRAPAERGQGAPPQCLPPGLKMGTASGSPDPGWLGKWVRGGGAARRRVQPPPSGTTGSRDASGPLSSAGAGGPQPETLRRVGMGGGRRRREERSEDLQKPRPPPLPSSPRSPRLQVSAPRGSTQRLGLGLWVGAGEEPLVKGSAMGPMGGGLAQHLFGEPLSG